MSKNVFALLACLSFAACGPTVVMQDPAGKYQLRADTDGDAEVVIGSALPGKQQIAFGRVNDGAELPDVLIEHASGADAAVDLLLLAVGGAQVPKGTVPVGTRIVTRADVETGGQTVPGPGDFILSLLLQQHAAALVRTGKPDLRILVIKASEGTDDPASSACILALDDARTAVSARRGLQLTTAGDDVDGVIVVSHDPAQSKPHIERHKDVPVVVLDPLLGEHGTTTVGCSLQALGKAAAEALRMLHPDGCAFACTLDQQNGDFEPGIFRGFVDGLGLKKPE